MNMAGNIRKSLGNLRKKWRNEFFSMGRKMILSLFFLKFPGDFLKYVFSLTFKYKITNYAVPGPFLNLTQAKARNIVGEIHRVFCRNGELFLVLAVKLFFPRFSTMCAFSPNTRCISPTMFHG
jgi:hypothetical protein